MSDVVRLVGDDRGMAVVGLVLVVGFLSSSVV